MWDDGRWWKMIEGNVVEGQAVQPCWNNKTVDDICRIMSYNVVYKCWYWYPDTRLPNARQQSPRRAPVCLSWHMTFLNSWSWAKSVWESLRVCGRIEEAEAGPLQQAWRHIAHKSDKIGPTILPESADSASSQFLEAARAPTPRQEACHWKFWLLLDLWTAIFGIFVHARSILAFPRSFI